MSVICSTLFGAQMFAWRVLYDLFAGGNMQELQELLKRKFELNYFNITPTSTCILDSEVTSDNDEVILCDG